MRWLAGLTLLALTTVVRAELDPALEQFLLQADVEVPNDPYRGEINIPGAWLEGMKGRLKRLRLFLSWACKQFSASYQPYL